MLTTILGTLAIIAATIALGVVVDRKWHIVPRKEKLRAAASDAQPPRRPLDVTHAPGAAPSTAVSATPAEREALRRKPCDACGGPTAPLPDDRVAFDGRELLVLHARCERCEARRTLYVQD